MKYQDLLQKTDTEIHRELAELRRSLHGLAAHAHIRQLKKVSEIQKVKRDIARMLTAIRSRIPNA
ncbi:MAG: 50S ribosomal protein L29 [Patescibacteria group bacterium]